MRPQVGGGDAAALPRSRKSSIVHGPSNQEPSGPPTAFFFASEEDMMASGEQDQSFSDLGARDEPGEPSKPGDSSYGVRSLDDALMEGLERLREHRQAAESRDRSERRSESPEIPRTPARKDESDAGDVRAAKQPLTSSPARERVRRAEGTRPLSLLQRAATPVSTIPSTPKSLSLRSLQLSDDEDEGASLYDGGSSQAVASSCGSGDDDEAGPSGVGLDATGSGMTATEPQLIMPSIKMPARRPFTDRGKQLGKLKVLVAGAEGAGKTNLIRSILQRCEDIVHVDPRIPTLPVLPGVGENDLKKKSKEPDVRTRSVTEIYASTRPYPGWWSDVDEDSRLQRRRSSVNEPVLERNICFVDTPGYPSEPAGQSQGRDAVIQYVEGLLRRNAEIWTLSEAELLGVLGGQGGVQVDLVLYVLTSPSNLAADVGHMQQLAELTNVIPLIGRSDELSTLNVAALKRDVLQEMQTQKVRPFLFGQSLEMALSFAEQRFRQEQQKESLPPPSENRRPENPFTCLADLETPSPPLEASAPFAISSLPGPDLETMDASLLMSPDYMQPLLPSELPALVSRIFAPDHAAWLRHTALKKFLSWRRNAYGVGALQLHNLNTQVHANDPLRASHPPSSHLRSPRSFASLPPFSPAQSPGPGPGSPFSFLSPPTSPPQGPTTHALALAADHAQHETRLAQVRLARWATDLDRSLRNERARYEALRRGEREKWIAEQVGILELDGRRSGTKRLLTHGESHPPGGAPRATRKVRRWKMEEDARWRDDPLHLHDLGIMLRVLGGAGVVGAVVVAVMKSWNQGGVGWLGLGTLAGRAESEKVFVCF